MQQFLRVYTLWADDGRWIVGRRLVGLLVIIGVLAQPHQAFAAPAASLVTIAPFLQEVRVTAADAGKEFSISLTNESQASQSFHLNVVDFGSLDDSGGIVFAGSKATSLLTKYGLTSWLKLQQNDVTIAAGQKVTVSATIMNHSDLQPGGHYAAIIASLKDTSALSQTGDNQISVQQQLTALVMATKVGGERYDLKLDGIKQASSWRQLPQSVSLHFQNPGNVHVVPRGSVTVMSATRQRVVARGIINEDSSFVLPGASRQLPVMLHAVASPELWPARYYVQVDYRYDGIDNFARRQVAVTFVNLPIIVMAAIGLSIVLTALIVFVRHRTYKRRQKSRKSSRTTKD